MNAIHWRTTIATYVASQRRLRGDLSAKTLTPGGPGSLTISSCGAACSRSPRWC